MKNVRLEKIMSEVKTLEECVKTLTNRNYSIAVNNGTEALYLSLISNGIGKGDEVIVPNFSWVSTASCVSMVGATPVFCDIDINTYHLSMQSVRRMCTSRTKAIIFAHLFGSMCETQDLKIFCQNHGILLVEDSCQAFGCSLNGQVAGSIGDISTFSFNTNKVVVGLTGGGMVLTDNEEVAERVKKLRHHGHGDGFEMLGRNSRMSEIDAEHILKQLEFFDQECKLREMSVQKYNKYFDLCTQQKPQGLISNYFRHTVRFDNKEIRDSIRDIFKLKVHYDRPISENSMYLNIDHKKDSCTNAQIVSDTIVTLPIRPVAQPVDEIYHLLVQKVFAQPSWAVSDKHNEKLIEAFYGIATDTK